MTLGCLAPYRRLGKDIFLLNLLENSSKCRGRISNSAVTNPEEGQIAKKKLYIMTLGCLAPYRRLGNDNFC